MKQQLAFVLSILTSTILPASLSQAAPLPTQTTQPATEQPATKATALTLEDLPAGFQELPPSMKAEIASKIEPFKQLLIKDNFPLDNFFAFVEPQKMEVIFGFTGMLSNQAQQGQFDAALQKARQPEFEQQIKKLAQKLPSSQQVKVLKYKSLPDLSNLAQLSTGFSLDATIQEMPVKFDVVSFRRSSVGAMTAVLYLTGNKPSVSVKDVATKLDGRVLQSSPATKEPSISQ
ncbi:MAG: hypothetical protein ACR2LR_26815 [Hassallia sp.]